MFVPLEGRKTYLIALAMIVYALIGYALGDMPQVESGKFIMEALAIAGLRAGIAKK